MQLIQSQLAKWVIVVTPNRCLSLNCLRAFLHGISIVINSETQLDQNKVCKLIVILNILNVYC